MENKWNINYIQTLPAQIQQKVLQKILKKVFITKKKYAQCKLSHTLKANVFELPHNKNFGKLFTKYELLLDQANFNSNPFQVLILQYPIPRDSLPPLTSL